jgi:soluble lytic murein transglycosylase-like protein
MAAGTAEEVSDLPIADALQDDGLLERPLDVPQLIVQAANMRGIDPAMLLRISWCESRWDPAAHGPGGAAGVFQFIPSTWASASSAAGFAGYSPFDARANVETAAWLIATDGPRQWTCQ